MFLSVFIKHNILEVHPHCCERQNFTFYGCVIFHSTYTPHRLYPFAHEHLVCFHILALVNSAALNFGVYVSFWISVFIFFPRYVPRRVVDGSYGIFSFLQNLFLAFCETSILFSIVPATVFNPTNSVQGSLFSTSSLRFVICRQIDDSYFDKCDIDISLSWTSLMISDVEHIFICL